MDSYTITTIADCLYSPSKFLRWAKDTGLTFEDKLYDVNQYIVVVEVEGKLFGRLYKPSWSGSRVEMWTSSQFEPVSRDAGNTGGYTFG